MNFYLSYLTYDLHFYSTTKKKYFKALSIKKIYIHWTSLPSNEHRSLTAFLKLRIRSELYFGPFCNP